MKQNTLTILLACGGLFTAAQSWSEVPQEVLEAEAARVDVVADASASTLAVFGPQAGGGGSGVLITPHG